MSKRSDGIASLANVIAYNATESGTYIDGAPHIKHPALRQLYGRLVFDLYDAAGQRVSTPSILDLGAGEGSVTLPFLELGARVTAVDISQRQLEALKEKTKAHGNRLEVMCSDIFDAIATLDSDGKRFDIIVCNSFLHHIPDYIRLIRAIMPITSSHGQFFSFQDPIRYDSIGRFKRMFISFAYNSWRIFKGDILGGIRRRIRRSKGIFHEDCPEDNVEYHAVRNGVDQDAIAECFRHSDYHVEIIRYFSTQSAVWQKVGTKLGIENTFATLAMKGHDIRTGQSGHAAAPENG